MNDRIYIDNRPLLIAINDFFVGGGQRLIADLTKQSPLAQQNIHLVTLVRNNERKNLLGELPSHIVLHHVEMRHFFDINGWFKVFKLLRQIQPHTVWTHFFFANTVFRLLKPLIGYRVIATEHNTYTWKTLRHRLIDKTLSLWTYRIVAVSAQVAEFTATQEWIRREKFVVIPNGVNVEKIQREISQYTKAEAQRSLSLPIDRKYMVNVARLATQKNHCLLIDSFAHFAKQNNEYSLLILGEGPLRPVLQKQIDEYHLSDRILLLGTQMDVSRYCRASEFFVLTSHIEGFALVCIEAMAAGLPVLAPRVAGPDEYLKEGENGYFISYNPEEVAEKMNMLASLIRENSNKFTQEAQRTAAHYDIRNTAKQYYDLLFSY